VLPVPPLPRELFLTLTHILKLSLFFSAITAAAGCKTSPLNLAVIAPAASVTHRITEAQISPAALVPTTASTETFELRLFCG